MAKRRIPPSPRALRVFIYLPGVKVHFTVTDEINISEWAPGRRERVCYLRSLLFSFLIRRKLPLQRSGQDLVEGNDRGVLTWRDINIPFLVVRRTVNPHEKVTRLR